VRRTIAIVVDDLTLSFDSTFRVRTVLRKFIETQTSDGDMIAIIRTGAGIGSLQQFTNDRRQLLLAIDRIKWSARGTGGVSAFEQVRGGRPRDIRSGAPNQDQNDERDEDIDELKRNIFGAGTLGAVGYIIRGMSELPGRKSVMLLSEGLTLFRRTSSGFMESTDLLSSLRLLVDQANRASVVINTMDARGLEFTGITASDSVGEMTENEIIDIENSRRQQLQDSQEGLRYLAQQTGGTAIANSNEFSRGMRRMLEDQSYYLVSYQPDDSTFDPKKARFHNIQVKVSRPGAHVKHRSGFFSISDEKLARDTRSSPERLASALVSPFAVNDVALRLNALFLNSKPNGSVVRSLIHMPVTEATFKNGLGGRKRAVIDVLAVAVGDQGQVIDQVAKVHTVDLSKEAYELSLKRGLVYDMAFPMKKPGGYQLRVAVRDHATDKVGSANQFVEVPDLKKKRLTASDIFLEGISRSEFEARVKDPSLATDASRSLVDTALRRFPTGSILNFGLAVYNAKSSPGQAPDLTAQMRIFRDGVVVFEGKPTAVRQTGRAEIDGHEYASAVGLGSGMVAGDYVMQLTVTDNLAGKKKNTINRYVQFELVN